MDIIQNGFANHSPVTSNSSIMGYICVVCSCLFWMIKQCCSVHVLFLLNTVSKGVCLSYWTLPYLMLQCILMTDNPVLDIINLLNIFYRLQVNEEKEAIHKLNVIYSIRCILLPLLCKMALETLNYIQLHSCFLLNAQVSIIKEIIHLWKQK